MKKFLRLLLASTSLSALCFAQNIVGDWQGTLNTGAAELRLVLHITKAADGTLKGTLDSIDQGANGIPVTSISLQGSTLKFASDSIRGSYEGKVDREATAVHGTWTQRTSLALDFQRVTDSAKTVAKPAAPSDIDGDWMGALDTGAIKLRLVFHIGNTANGLTATLDSPDQNAKGIPVTAVTRNGPSLKIELKAIGGVFDGKINKDLTAIDGTWSQGGSSFPLALKRAKDQAELEPRRPQNPVKPYPYREEQVSYDNKTQHVTLAATLTIPSGKGPFPGVLLITGSGPQDRDESLMGHKPFLVLSDYLTRKGIVVLRADDRGVGKSTGTFTGWTTADFATDAEAGVGFLRTRAEVAPHKIGLVGHSEGAIIASMLAARNPDVAFIVMMAGPGVPGKDILPQQTLLILKATGRSQQEAENASAHEREILELAEQQPDDALLEEQLREQAAGRVPEAQMEGEIKTLTSPWFRYFLTYDPAASLRKITCPVLAIGGEKDLQVPAKQNLPVIRQALEEAGNKHFEVDELPGLNHLFQTARTGAPSEYAEIEETISPVAMDKIASWILQQ